MAVTTELFDGVLQITLDNPPVNALGAAVRAGLAEALDRIDADESIVAAVITGAGGFFSGGADIKEFGKPIAPPLLPDLLVRLEAARVPVVAAIGGPALGGGCETALACRYRIAGPKASIGLPEVKLGLIPGAGGTQRLPRAVGVRRAAEMITGGAPVSAAEALEIGLVEEVAEGDLAAAARAFARTRAEEGARAPLSAVAQPPDWDEAWLDGFEAKLKARARGQFSPMQALAAVRASGTLPFADGLKRERELFQECMESDQRKGLIHAFFAERAAKKVPALEGAAPRPVETVGVLGAGTMGAGIAAACAQHGLRVLLFDVDGAALEKGCARIAKIFDREAEKGRMGAEDAAAATARVEAAAGMDAFADADLIIEAVVERMDVKTSVFAELDRIAKPGAVLATNTSYLDINEIAATTGRPEDVVGMHFFSPANVMRLLEIIRPEKASKEALATALAVGTRLKKVSVLAGVCDGFIGNRILKAYRKQAEYLVEDGAAPEQVDAALRDFGFAMGPFEVSDLAGLDIGWHTRRREDGARDPRERYVAIADRLYELGRLGQKTGAGWYRYEAGDRTPYPDPVVAEIIVDEAAKKGIARRAIDDEEIRQRILYAMVNEGAKILEEGIAARALDIDLVFLHGYGFPAYRGGPMFYGDLIGPARVLEGVRAFAREDAYAWRPAGLIERLAAEGGRFADAGAG